MDCSPSGSSVQGISQARLLEWIVISSPGDLSNPRIEPVSPALAGRFFITEPPGKPIGKDSGGGLVYKSFLTLVTPWTIACWAPLSMGFPRQEFWSGLLFPSPGDLPDPGIEPTFPALQVDSLQLNHQGSPLVAITTPENPTTSCHFLWKGGF